MTQRELESLLEDVAAGRMPPGEATRRLRSETVFEDLGFARVDHAREVRCGHPEVIFGLGKLPADLTRIAHSIVERSGRVLVTRVDAAGADALRETFADGTWEDRARCFVVDRREAPEAPVGRVLVVSAGTSDLPVAEEARVTASVTGSAVETLYDAGVAGIHRLLGSADRLRGANAVVVVAGMEGALASVVGGLCDVPVVAVPTSVGYGASFGGIAPLLAMLNSCAAGVSVVNIDNGFGAGFLASRINRLIASARP